MAALTDVMYFKISNKVNVTLMVLGLAFHAWQSGWSGAGASLLGWGLGMTLFLPAYGAGMLGAGDVKFVGALGCCLGVRVLLPTILFGAIANGIYGAGVLVVRGQTVKSAAKSDVASRESVQESVQEIARTSCRRQRLVPFSAMMMLGVLSAIAYCCT